MINITAAHGSIVGYVVPFPSEKYYPIVPEGYQFDKQIIYRLDGGEFTEADRVYLTVFGVELRSPVYWANPFFVSVVSDAF